MKQTCLTDLDLTKRERAFLERATIEDVYLPWRITPYWRGIMGDNESCPLRRQAVPSIEEFHYEDYELDDPLGDNVHSPISGLVHHYNDRALILMTDQCALYCRHCFRRHHTGDGEVINEEKLNEILSYIRERKSIHELILSGGDALLAPEARLKQVFDEVRSWSRPIVIRVGTRLPVVDPGRITDRILDILSSYPSLWLVIQVNHIKEMTPDFNRVISQFLMRGIPILNQSVLLKGVNDSLDDLIDLSYGLLERKIKPYYLFQGDLARGTKHFRVPLGRALELYDQLTQTVSHTALPRFSLDLPGGGGKVNLEKSELIKKNEREYIIERPDGGQGIYPMEKEDKRE